MDEKFYLWLLETTGGSKIKLYIMKALLCSDDVHEDGD